MWNFKILKFRNKSEPTVESHVFQFKVPIYFSAGMTEKANNYYKMFISWTNEKIRKTFVERNMFDFRHIKSFDR